MGSAFFRKILLIHILVLCLPTLLCSLNLDDSDHSEVDVHGRKIPRHFLEALKDAQQFTVELRTLASTRKTTGTKTWTPEERVHLRKLAIKYDQLTWEIKLSLDKTLGRYSHLSHKAPTFDENGEPQLSDPFFFTYVSNAGELPEKKLQRKHNHYMMCFEFSDKLHEIAYRNILRYVENLMRFILCNHYIKMTVTPPSSLKTSDLSDLHDQRISAHREIRGLALSLFANYGFDPMYENRGLNSLTSVHLSDQNPNGFRVASNAYLKEKTLTKEQMTEAYTWLRLKIARANEVIRCLSSEIHKILEMLQCQGWLERRADTPSSLNESSNNPTHDFNFTNWFFNDFGHRRKIIPLSMGVLEEVKARVKEIWALSGLPPDPRGILAPARNDPASHRMFRIFCETLEKRLDLTVAIHQQHFSLFLSSDYCKGLVTLEKKHRVNLGVDKKSRSSFMTYSFDIQATPHHSGPVELLNMKAFENKWKGWTHFQRQLHVSLQLLEYIFTCLEASIYEAYKEPLRTLFLRLWDGKPDTEPMKSWSAHAASLLQEHTDKIHLFVHSLFPEFNLPNILNELINGPNTYLGLTCALSYLCYPEKFSELQGKRQLLSEIVKAFGAHSVLVLMPTSQLRKDIDPKDLNTARLRLKTPPPKAPLFFKGKTFEAKDKRPLSAQIETSFYIIQRKERARAAYTAKQGEDNKEFPQLSSMATTYYNAHYSPSWADMRDEDPVQGEFIKANFDPFFKWYWKNIEIIRGGKTPALLPEEKVPLG